MRTLTRSLVLTLGLALAGGSTAMAQQDVKSQYKEIKKDHKKVAKLVKKFEKGLAKGKQEKYIPDIREFAKNELADLRGMGVKTKDPKPKPQHPAEAGNAPAPKPESKTPHLDKIADHLKNMRDMRGQNKLNAMKKVEMAYGKWEDRLKAKL